MNTVELLLSKRLIAKGQDKDIYYKMKDEAGRLKKFFSEKLGYQIIINPYLIKLEKLPAKAEIYMGILDFTEKIQYIFFCMILMFLEDKEAEEQFVLSELTEYIQSKYTEEAIDWTLYQYRRHLVRVIKFCLSEYILTSNDGDEDDFAASHEGEVLYENTGISRYVMRNFTKSILEYRGIKDFETGEWIDVEENRGIVRRHRVYRKLLSGPMVFKESEEDEDFVYIKQYRGMIAADFEQVFPCELQVHKTSAYLILGEGCNAGKSFPSENTLSDIVLLCCDIIRGKIDKGEVKLRNDETADISHTYFRTMIEECKQTYQHGFNKTYREKTSTEFYEQIKDEMLRFGFITEDDRKEYIRLMPVIGKLIGRFPEEFENEGGTKI